MGTPPKTSCFPTFPPRVKATDSMFLQAISYVSICWRFPPNSVLFFNELRYCQWKTAGSCSIFIFEHIREMKTAPKMTRFLTFPPTVKVTGFMFLEAISHVYMSCRFPPNSVLFWRNWGTACGRQLAVVPFSSLSLTLEMRMPPKKSCYLMFPPRMKVTGVSFLEAISHCLYVLKISC